MSSPSILARIRRPLVGAAMTAALAIGSLAATVPAQADTRDANTAPWTVSATGKAPTPRGVGVQALCFPPTRYSNGAVWSCDVFSGQYIQAWMTCGGVTYYSNLIGEGSWWIVGICPPGTWRDDEGIYYY
ncbi:hypothetical protein [Actinophytocola sp.]|uniref:hypothetical protein n=1 Tax=Actinophytocola sp. TaxID=1872138 RepID=UPI002D80141D|nr:hypothetical protein [Actinophytocola sp.]HET9140333.1 hypothetical protein [Actinophytocola sp.]